MGSCFAVFIIDSLAPLAELRIHAGLARLDGRENRVPRAFEPDRDG